MARRFNPQLNASGMADIAFLLLIFFLVATTFLNEKGVKATLPIYYEGPPGKMADEKVLNIKLNKFDEVLLEGSLTALEDVHDAIIHFVSNPNQSKGFSKEAVISLQHDAHTSYRAYVSLYSSIKSAYLEMRNDLAMNQFDQSFKDLSIKDRNYIIETLPIKISEAEPFTN